MMYLKIQYTNDEYVKLQVKKKKQGFKTENMPQTYIRKRKKIFFLKYLIEMIFMLLIAFKELYL